MPGERVRRARGDVAWPKRPKEIPVWLVVAGVILVALCFAVQNYVAPVLAASREEQKAPAARTLVINEVMSSNQSALRDDRGRYPDWIELINVSGAPVDATGWTVTDGDDRLVGFTFPDETIAPGQCVLIYCSGALKNVRGYAYHAPFRLSAQGEEVVLRDAGGRILDQLSVPSLLGNQAYARGSAGAWAKTTRYTPGLPNTNASYRQIVQAQGGGTGDVVINELMGQNMTHARARDGGYYDYVELYNGGQDQVDLTGWTLTDDEGKPGKWHFPDGTRIGAGECLLVYASGLASADGALHASFRLSADGEAVTLYAASGVRADQVVMPFAEPDRAYVRLADGTFTSDEPPTPGQPNTVAGIAATERALRAGNALQLYLNEAMASARKPNANKSVSDWVELYNASTAEIDLSGYGLSDDPSAPRKWQFPSGAKIQAGGYMAVVLSGLDKSAVKTGTYHTNFKLSFARGETLTLSKPDGIVIDRLPLFAQVAGVSYGRVPGRDGYAYLAAASRGEPNTTVGYVGQVEDIAFSAPGGWARGSAEVSMYAGEGVTIRYTLDASEPTENSPAYAGPITLTQNTIVRARGYQQDMLPSRTCTQSYLFGEKHTLPVVSLVTDPTYLDDPKIGIYTVGEKKLKYPYTGANFWKDWERAGNIEYFGADGTPILSQGAGISLQGQYSRMQNQKAFKVTARNAYGPNRFDASLFPNREYTTYRSFLLRASGQDSSRTRMRDAVLTSLAEGTTVMYQDALPVVVYVNGKYFGHYNMRERIHKYSIAQWEGWEDLDAIDIVKGNSGVKQGTNEDYEKFLTWLKKNGCKTEENLARVYEMVDVDNYLDYVALEMYTGNTDLLNVKRYRSSEGDGRWRWVLYDTDWAFYTDTDSFRRWLDKSGAGSGKKTDNTLFVQLMRNPDIKAQFLTRMGELMYTHFRADLVLAKMDAWQVALEPEMAAHFERWGGSEKNWKAKIKEMRAYATSRPKKMLGYIKKELGWSNTQMREYFGEIMAELGM